MFHRISPAPTLSLSDFFLAHNLMSIQSAPAQSSVAVRQFARLHGEPFLEGNSKSKPQKKSKQLLATEPLPACSELMGEPIEVQEFLQSVVREFQRRVGESTLPRTPDPSCAI